MLTIANVLIFDEMKIREDLVFDKTRQITGFVDYGQFNLNSHCETEERMPTPLEIRLR